MIDPPSADVPVHSWLYEFHPFTPTHAVVVIVAAAVTYALVRRRRPLGTSPAGRRLDRRLGLGALLHWVAYGLYGFWQVAVSDGTGKYTLEYALPLQICDLASLLAPVAWLTDRRWASVLLYFWGIGLSTQAFATPVVTTGPATAEFWMFFNAHTIIVGGAVYEVAGRRFRPTWGDFRFATIVSLSYLAVLLPFNVATGYNIGYFGRPKAGRPATLADALGPWPLRVIWMTIVAIGAMALAMLPWVGRREGAGGRTNRRGPAGRLRA